MAKNDSNRDKDMKNARIARTFPNFLQEHFIRSWRKNDI